MTHAMTTSGHAMPTTTDRLAELVKPVYKRRIQSLTEEISQRLAILKREGFDVSDAMDNIRDINLALAEDIT